MRCAHTLCTEPATRKARTRRYPLDVCDEHFDLLRQAGELLEDPPNDRSIIMAKTCEIPDCDRPTKAKGRCAPHYQQLQRELARQAAPAENQAEATAAAQFEEAKLRAKDADVIAELRAKIAECEQERAQTLEAGKVQAHYWEERAKWLEGQLAESKAAREQAVDELRALCQSILCAMDMSLETPTADIAPAVRQSAVDRRLATVKLKRLACDYDVLTVDRDVVASQLARLESVVGDCDRLKAEGALIRRLLDLRVTAPIASVADAIRDLLDLKPADDIPF